MYSGDEFYGDEITSPTERPIQPPKRKAEQPPCPHPPKRQYAWIAYDNTLCVGCCDCGAILKGASNAR